VIPVYFPPGRDCGLAVELLRDTVEACRQLLSQPAHLCLSVDGEEAGRPVAEQLCRATGARLCVAPANRGKLQALRLGVAQLWPEEELAYFCVVDADGDHFANELPTLMRAALHARAQPGVDQVLVLGSRTSRHRPMGWLRGELEELADRVLLDAMAYHAAISGQPLRLALANLLDEYPDFHSGYKLFSRDVVPPVFLDEPELCGVEPAAYFRHGCEAVMSVEAYRAGADLVCVNRTTLNEQPVSTFGRLDRERLVADKIIWPCRRLGVPPAFLDQWLRNHIPRLQLTTLTPDGKRELVAIRKLIAADYPLPAVDDEALTAGPLFL